MDNKLIYMLFSGMLLTAPLSLHAQYHSQVWNPDNGNGTYTNPVLYADYSDPDVIAVGDDYYLTASSFNCIPGLPILHSKDLVNWQIIGYALQELKNCSVSLSTAKECGRQPYAITMANCISIGATPTTASLW